MSLVKPGIVDGTNTPSPEPGHLRRDADGALLSHVIAPQTVAAAVAGAIETGDAEVDIVEP